MAGDADVAPSDSPQLRLDAADEFAGVGALIGDTFGTCTAISRHWVLTAAHVVRGLGPTSRLYVVFTKGGVRFTYDVGGANAYANPAFDYSTGLHDSALVYIPEGISNEIPKYRIYSGPVVATTVARDGTVFHLAGYGRSGYGDAGYSTGFTQTERRVGANVVEWLDSDGDAPSIFGMKFDDPATTGDVGGSLGNRVETTFGAGDSGGPSFVLGEDGVYRLAGINTMIGAGDNAEAAGTFGSYCYGVLVSSVMDWVESYAAEWSRATVSARSNDWFSSPWYGTYYESDDSGDWIYSQTHGWQYVWPTSTPDGVWIYDFDTGSWWVTSEDLYPYFFNYSDSSWYYFVGDVNPGRRFYSYRLGLEIAEEAMP